MSDQRRLIYLYVCLSSGGWQIWPFEATDDEMSECMALPKDVDRPRWWADRKGFSAPSEYTACVWSSADQLNTESRHD